MAGLLRKGPGRREVKGKEEIADVKEGGVSTPSLSHTLSLPKSKDRQGGGPDMRGSPSHLIGEL